MKLLCIDVGSGTQDIILLDTSQTTENALQLVVPSPTVRVARRIEAATAQGKTLVLRGELMGGGACTGAMMAHLKVGLPVYATEKAALSFNDNLEKLASAGVQLISEDETSNIRNGLTVETGDIDLDSLSAAVGQWGIDLKPDAIAVAVLDHGAAPPDESQRTFRFELLKGLLQNNPSLEALVFPAADIPAEFTRMQAVVRSIDRDVPVFLMDTGAAAVMGAYADETIADEKQRLAMNLGNSHTIAFLLNEKKVIGFFEHHTDSLSREKLEGLLEKLVAGRLTNAEVWNDGGHGSLLLDKPTGVRPFTVATGPRRELMAGSRMKPYFAAPFGSMMVAGCYGLALGIAAGMPSWRGEIEKALRAG